MMETVLHVSSETEDNISQKQINAVHRITALWALSEAGLGGVLHAFRIPFTGLFIGGSAVLLITLLATFKPQKGAIIRATILVMIVKGLVSPHTPLMSYAAVFLQGVLGELLFGLIPSKRVAGFVLAVTALLLSALQKFLVTTLVFGMNVWHSIDLFGNYVISQFFLDSKTSVTLPISYSLIGVYTFIHLIAGVIVGLKGPGLARRIYDYSQNPDNLFILPVGNDAALPDKKSRRRKIIKKLSGYLLFFIAGAIMVLSYIFPVFDQSQGAAALIMVVRSVMIMTIWYFLLGPFLLKRLRSFLAQKETAYSADVESIMTLLPVFRSLVKGSWQESAGENRYRRFNRFIFLLIARVLTVH
ncbi:MAG TPA: hypothetical protein ENK44_12475 [Caldithrix abyssi]|uniref:Uncharacterized protein n=1 Tax=Caldithrix abyssi TaxID=187145 RepID=A0A7V4U1U6_CALAY|nr:hypothetical protein [Caldithrix abyssi]